MSRSSASSGKKRKRGLDIIPKHETDTSKPTAIFKPTEGRAYTLSIALPGSIIANAQSPELKIGLAGQVARALAVFCVDEVVIFDDNPDYNGRSKSIGDDSYTGYSDPNYFLAHILSYLETPPHLRKLLFPMHPDLKLAGAAPSLDMPHHLRAHEWCQYREGITIERSQTMNGGGELGADHGKKKKKQKQPRSESSTETLVESGLPYKVSVPASIPPDTRVTLKFARNDEPSTVKETILTAAAVAPSTPREEAGYYWGYSVRPAPSISAVLTECSFDGGYDLTFGTSERGIPLSTLNHPTSDSPSIPEFSHMLIVFGGVAGLEVAVKGDKELTSMDVSDPKALFDFWVNLCPGQGSRTIRTEEAVWLGLMGLKDIVARNGRN